MVFRQSLRPSAVHTEFDLGVVLVDCATREAGERQAIRIAAIGIVRIGMANPVWQIVQVLQPKHSEGDHRASGATTTRQCEEKKRTQASVSRSQEFQGSDCHWFLSCAKVRRICNGDAVDRARADHRTQEAQWLLPELADADFVGSPAIIVSHIVFSLHRLLGGGIHFDRSFRDVSGERFARCGARNWGCVRTSRTPKKSPTWVLVPVGIQSSARAFLPITIDFPSSLVSSARGASGVARGLGRSFARAGAPPRLSLIHI